MDKVIAWFMALLILTGLAVVVSSKAKTSSVLDSLLGGIANLQRAAVSPVTGK